MHACRLVRGPLALVSLGLLFLFATPARAQDIPGHHPRADDPPPVDREAEARSEMADRMARLEDLVQELTRQLEEEAAEDPEVADLVEDSRALLESETGMVPDLAPEESGEPAETRRWHTVVEIALSVGVLVFGLILTSMMSSFLVRGFITGSSFLKLFVLTTVVTAGLFVVVAGYTQDQIAPMMGLLGTLVGYLLGREGPGDTQGAGGPGAEGGVTATRPPPRS